MNSEYMIARKYARALLGSAIEQEAAPKVLEDLEKVSQQLAVENRWLKLNHPANPIEQKISYIQEITGGKISQLVKALLELLVRKRRFTLLFKIIEIYRSEWMDEQGQQLAKVVSATPLSAEQTSDLRKQLAQLMKSNIDLEHSVDQSLQAGIRIEIGDKVIDSTIQGRFARLKRQLISGN